MAAQEWTDNSEMIFFGLDWAGINFYGQEHFRETINSVNGAMLITIDDVITNVIEDDDISIDLVVNMDQTPLSYVTPCKYTFNPSGVKTVPIKGTDDKRQITTTFAVAMMTGKFLPVQVIYEGKIH